MLSNLIDKITRKRGSRSLYLGEIFINPRSSAKAFMEYDIHGENSPEELRLWISELMELPLAKLQGEIPTDALILDVAVLKYQAGTDIGLYADPFIPLFWRPSVKLKVRLREHNRDRVLGEYATKKIITWSEYFNRFFSLRVLLNFKGAFSSNDLKHLLGLALLDALVWAKNKSN